MSEDRLTSTCKNCLDDFYTDDMTWDNGYICEDCK